MDSRMSRNTKFRETEQSMHFKIATNDTRRAHYKVCDSINCIALIRVVRDRDRKREESERKKLRKEKRDRDREWNNRHETSEDSCPRTLTYLSW